jgi:hypothetical protein
LTLTERLLRLLKDLIILAITGGIIYFFNTIEVMMTSTRVFRWLLYVAITLHSIGFCSATYMTWVISRTDPDFENCDGMIKFTTATFVSGGLLWTISVWPVFHFWSILLGLCFLFFTVTFVSVFSIERPRAKIN